MPLGTRWPAAQDDLLRLHYGKMDTADLAALLGRSVSAVTQRAFHTGLCAKRGTNGGRARGVLQPSGSISISVYFDKETFDEVSRMAKEDKLPFSRAVLQLVEWGLMDRAGSMREAA